MFRQVPFTNHSRASQWRENIERAASIVMAGSWRKLRYFEFSFVFRTEIHILWFALVFQSFTIDYFDSTLLRIEFCDSTPFNSKSIVLELTYEHHHAVRRAAAVLGSVEYVASGWKTRDLGGKQGVPFLLAKI